MTQTYYSDATASQYDPNYQSSFNTLAKPSSFSPVRIQSRVSPTDRFQTDFSTEFNSTVQHLHDVHRERQLQQRPLPADRRLERSAG